VCAVDVVVSLARARRAGDNCASRCRQSSNVAKQTRKRTALQCNFKYVCDVIELLHSSFLILQVLDEKETAVYKRALEEQYKLKMKASRCACCPTCLAF